jgi:hypothetical protein
MNYKGDNVTTNIQNNNKAKFYIFFLVSEGIK